MATQNFDDIFSQEELDDLIGFIGKDDKPKANGKGGLEPEKPPPEATVYEDAIRMLNGEAPVGWDATHLKDAADIASKITLARRRNSAFTQWLDTLNDTQEKAVVEAITYQQQTYHDAFGESFWREAAEAGIPYEKIKAMVITADDRATVRTNEHIKRLLAKYDLKNIVSREDRVASSLAG